MGKFLSKMISLGIEYAVAYPSAKKKAEQAGNVLRRLTSGNEEVPIDEFLEMYDMRIYNFESKQDDIKFVKKYDFEGVYIIHNCSRKIYHVGRSSRVLRKVDRTFRGYENQNVYEDWTQGNEFKVRFVPLESSGYSDTASLEKAIQQKYGTYTWSRFVQPQKHRSGFLKKIVSKWLS